MLAIVIIRLRELGIKCWLPNRFIGLRRCDRWGVCNYPEKKSCKARIAEIAYEVRMRIQSRWDARRHRMRISKLEGGEG